LLISTKHLCYLPTHQTEFCRGLARPTHCTAQWMHRLLHETHQETYGRR